MELKQKLENLVETLEKDVELYNQFINNPESSVDDRKVVSFKLMYEMIALNSLAKAIDYPLKNTTSAIMLGLKGASEYVSVVNGKVEVLPAFKEVLKMKDDFLKAQKN